MMYWVSEVFRRVGGGRDERAVRAAVEPVERRVLLAAVSVSNLTVDEGARGAVVVSLDGPVGRDVQVRYETQDASGKARRNYVPKRGVAVIKAGETSAQFMVKANKDGVHSGVKQFRVRVTEVNGAEVGKGFGMVRIRNTDPAPVVTIVQANPKVWRPAAGTRAMAFDIRMTGKSELPVKVTYATQNGTAKAGQDYVRAQRQVTFSPGKAGTVRVDVTVRGSKAPQPNEVFAMKLTKAQNATLGRAFSAGTIMGAKNLPEGNVVSAGDVVVEGGGEAGMTLSLNQMPATPVVVNYWTVDGSAVGGVDYVPVQGSVTFAPGETERVVGVGTSALAAGGAAKGLSVSLSAQRNVSVGDGSGAVTIVAPGTLPAPGAVPGAGPEITGEGIAFSPQSEWKWVGNYFDDLKFNYVLTSTRAVRPAGLRVELFVAPQDADLRGYTPFRSEAVTGAWGADGVLRGTIDASRAVIPAGASGLWQIHGRLVDAQGVVYAKYGSFLLRV